MGSSLQMMLSAFPQIAQVTQYLGSADLLYLAARIARARPVRWIRSLRIAQG